MDPRRALRGLSLKIALDTTILVYAEGVNGPARRTAALEVLNNLRRDNSLEIPVQALGELFSVLQRKAGYSPADARSAILAWRSAASTIDTTDAVLLGATDLVLNHFAIWDAVIVCAAAESGCGLLLSEDMQDGFVWRGVTIVNPFAAKRHPLLEALLS